MNSQNTPVQIITHNTFQMPWLTSAFCKYIKRDGESTCVGQLERAERLCDLVQDYDVCLLQEMWGSNMGLIRDSLAENYDFPKQLVENIKEGRMADYKNAYLSTGQKTGGLFMAIKKEMPIIWYRHHVFENNEGEETSYKSVGFTLLKMHRYWRGRYLLVINAHLSGEDVHKISDVRAKQRKEIMEELVKISHEEHFPLGFKWTDCGVILGGDFNTAAIDTNNGNAGMEYTQTLIDFGSDSNPYGSYTTENRARDLYKDHNFHDRHSETFNVSRNSFADSNNIMQSGRIDYLLTMNAIPVGNNMFTPVMRLTCTKCKILEQDQGMETSDHYPVMATIIPAEGPVPSAPKLPSRNPSYYIPETGRFEGHSNVTGGYAAYGGKKYF